jgi:hypothetical protein
MIGWAALTVLGAVATVAAVNGRRFPRRVAHEAAELMARRGPPAGVTSPAPLPEPVRRYLGKSIGRRANAICGARLRYGGSFRPSLASSWLPIRGEQHFAANPPGFVWRGRVRVLPGVWIDARDRSIDGAGNMLVLLESTIPLANRSGPDLDQGALLRLLGEMVWFPTALLDDRYVRWSAVDDKHARATLEVNGRTVTGEFAFGGDDLPATFSAIRNRDLGGGRSAPTPFLGRMSDFRHVDQVLVPHRVVGAWIVDGRTFEYADFSVERVEFDWADPRPLS